VIRRKENEMATKQPNIVFFASGRF